MHMAKKRIYVDKIPLRLRVLRLIWYVTYCTLFRWTPRLFFGKWRLMILKIFGAKIGQGCKVDPTCFIWAPWNLVLGDLTCIAGNVDVYSVDNINIGSNVAISQRSFICTASHDISTLSRPLIHKPIVIEDHAWICAEAFIGLGVTIGEGAVVGARSVVSKNVDKWTVVAGNPAVFIKKRVLKGSEQDEA